MHAQRLGSIVCMNSGGVKVKPPLMRMGSNTCTVRVHELGHPGGAAQPKQILSARKLSVKDLFKRIKKATDKTMLASVNTDPSNLLFQNALLSYRDVVRLRVNAPATL